MSCILSLFLIAGLGHPDFSSREACEAILTLAPEMAVPLLWERYPDPEIRRRLEAVRHAYNLTRQPPPFRYLDVAMPMSRRQVPLVSAPDPTLGPGQSPSGPTPAPVRRPVNMQGKGGRGLFRQGPRNSR